MHMTLTTFQAPGLSVLLAVHPFLIPTFLALLVTLIRWIWPHMPLAGLTESPLWAVVNDGRLAPTAPVTPTTMLRARPRIAAAGYG